MEKIKEIHIGILDSIIDKEFIDDIAEWLAINNGTLDIEEIYDGQNLLSLVKLLITYDNTVNNIEFINKIKLSGYSHFHISKTLGENEKYSNEQKQLDCTILSYLTGYNITNRNSYRKTK
jgi:hypothetical protein